VTIELVANKILQIKDTICGMLDQSSLLCTKEELCENGNEEEIINTHLDDIQELYIELASKVEKLESRRI